MRLIAHVLEWVEHNLHGAALLTGHVVLLHEDCPHCGERTLCEISAFHGHYRCVECGGAIREEEKQPTSVPQGGDGPLVPA
jgi:DNA-directed RNA polymerase subunit RPC12/RpoP